MIRHSGQTALTDYSNGAYAGDIVKHSSLFEMVHFIASMCDGAVRRDGVGFNRYDAVYFSCILARYKSISEMPESVEAEVRSKLHRYRKQLSCGYPAGQITRELSI